ncbi:MAG: metallophosphoesterase, partial [Planctomycetota bacterium]
PNPKPKWEDAINWWLNRVKDEDPEFIAVAGDLVDGHWWDGPDLVQHMGNVYYGGWVRRMRDHGLDFYVAIGDHELGDDPWPEKKRKLMADFERAFVRHTNMPRNGPEGFKGRAYYVKHGGLLFITVQTFEKHGDSIRPTVSGKQLEWVENTLEEHGPDVNHIVVQGHAPILPGVKSRSSSQIMLEDGADSGLWQVMKEHNVDLYLCGEHHAITCKEKDGIWQIVHGNSWGRSSVSTGSYLRVDVHPDKLVLALKQIPFEFGGGDIWNINKGTGPRDIVRISDETKAKGFETVGMVTIHKKSDGEKSYSNVSGAFKE